MIRLRHFWIVAVASACVGSETEPIVESATVRDSAGISILSVYASEPPEYTIRDTFDIRIGVPEGDERYQLYQVRGVRPLGDSSILVLNAGTHQLRRYGWDGRWLTSYGRRGAGPGELQFPVMLAAAQSDSSIVLDLMHRGFHVADPDGRISRTQSLQTSLSGFVGLVDSQTAVLATPRRPRGAYDQVVATDVVVALVNLGTSARDSLFTLSGPQEYTYTRGELVRSVPIPFTTFPAVGVRDGEVYVVAGYAPEVRIYSQAGELLRIVRFPFNAAPVTEAEWETVTSRLSESRASVTRGEGRLTPQEVERERQIYKTVTRPQTKPFFDMIYLHDPGRIWLREYNSPGSPLQRWISVDQTGKLVSTAAIPGRLYVRAINDSWVLGQEVDPLGVEYVVRYSTTAGR